MKDRVGVATAASSNDCQLAKDFFIRTTLRSSEIGEKRKNEQINLTQKANQNSEEVDQ